jgi:hypothetical protein
VRHSRLADLFPEVAEDLVVDVVQHSDPQHDLVVVLVQVLPVLLVQVHPDVVLVFGDPGDAEWRVPTLARPAVFPLPPCLPASRDWI